MIVSSGSGLDFDSPFTDEQAKQILLGTGITAAVAIGKVPAWNKSLQYHAHRLAYRNWSEASRVYGLGAVLRLLCSAAKWINSPEIFLESEDWGLHVSLGKDRQMARVMRNGGLTGSRVEQCIGELSLDSMLVYVHDDHAVAVLTELSGDLRAAIKRYGTLSGKCVFCRRELGPEGAATGYGPKCGRAYDLIRDNKAEVDW